MQRRAELARAMINNPAVMILDEPFRGLDAMTKVLMWEYYAALFEETRRTNFFVTTDIDEAIFLADRLLIMSSIPTQVRAVLEIDVPRPRTQLAHGGERPRQRDQDAGAVDPARGSDEVLLARQQGGRRLRRRLLQARQQDVGAGRLDWLLTREAVITLAVLAAIPSVAASLLQVRGKISAARARQLNFAGYVLMGISMALFIVIGFRGPAAAL